VLNIRKRKCKYGVVQQETCPTTGRIHWQGYIELPNSMTRTQIQTAIFDDPTVHIEPRRGTAEQARNYCMKLDTRVAGTEPTEWGEMSGQGSRTDLIPLTEMATQLAAGTMTMRQAVEHNPELVVKHHRGLAFVAEYATIKKSIPFRHITTYVVWGDPGTGKSAGVAQWCEDRNLLCYKQACELGAGIAQWWNGCTEEHQVLHLEDFAGFQSIALTFLLQILDGNQCRAQTKGSFTYLMHHTVWIVSNISPEDWYPTEPQVRINALMRRIHSITRYVASEEVKKDQRPIIQKDHLVTMKDIRRIREGIILRPNAQSTTVGEQGPHAIGALQPTRIEALQASRLSRELHEQEEDRELFDRLAFDVYRDMQPSNTGAPPTTMTPAHTPTHPTAEDHASDASSTDFS